MEKFRCNSCLTVFEDIYDSEVKPCVRCGEESDSYGNSSSEDWNEIHKLRDDIVKLKRELSHKSGELEQKIEELNEVWRLELTLKDVLNI